MHLPKRNKQSPVRAADWPTKEEFHQQVDFAVKLFKLNPDLPEIQELKDGYDELSDPRAFSMDPMWYLHQLDPHYTVTRGFEGELYIDEAPLGIRTLKIWSLIRHHEEFISTELCKIVANGAGLYLYNEHGTKLVTVGGIPINPHRLGDPGNRYEYACGIIREFTGVELDWREHIGRTKAITVERNSDTSDWQVHIDQLEPVG